MISMRIKKFHKRTGRKLQAKWNPDSKIREGRYNGNKARDNGRRPAYQDDSKALVTMDREDIDWSGYVEEDTQNFSMMAYSSSNSGSDNEKLLAEALKEKEDLKTKVKNWQNSSKNLNRLLNTQLSANDKFGLGYGDYRYGSILSYENEVLQSVFMNKECDLENTPVNDRYAEGMHTVPPPMTGNYMPSGPDVEIDYPNFTYGPKQTLVDESDAKTYENASSESDSSVEITTSMPDPVDNTPKVVSKPKVWTDAPIIEEYESDGDDDSVSNVQENIEKPSFAFTDSVKHVKSPRENVKETGTPNHYPKIKKQDRHSHTRKGLGYAFTRKSCFVCGSFSHPIRNCDFQEKIMAKQVALTKKGIRDDPHKALKDKGIINSGWSRHMTGNKDHLVDYQEFKGGFVAFGGSNERITGKGKIKAGRLDFEDVYYMEELKHYNLLFMSQICDKKNKVLFINIDCLVLSPDFKLPNENQVLLKIPRQHNMYSFNLKNIDPSRDLSYLFAKALIDKSNKWHRRLGHKGKQHKASCKAKTEEPEKLKRQEKEAKDAARKEATHENQDANTNSTNLINVVSAPVSAVGPSKALNDDESTYPNDPSMPHLADIYASTSVRIFTNSSYDDEGVVTDFNNLETTANTRSKVHKNSEAHALVSYIQKKQRNNHKDFQHCLFACFLSQVEPKKISQALEDNSWVDAMQEELLQFQIQKVWVLVYMPFGKKANGTKWVYRNKKDARGVIVRNKVRLVEQGHLQEEEIDCDDIFAPVARIEAIRIFLDFASYLGFIVYQMDMKSAFLYGTIDEEVYVIQPPGFVDPKFPNKVYKVVKALYGLHQAPRACVKAASTLIETQKPLFKDEDAADVDVHLYRSMIGSLMYLTASSPDIMYLKGQPKLGLWCPKASSFNLEAYSDSDYAGATLDRKSTTRAALLKGMLLEVTNVEQQLLLPSIVQEQTSLGKDFSKPFMADNLPKIIWFSTQYASHARFDQIVDFLNAQIIQYALMVTPTIYVSCIKQFWATASIKKVKDVVKLQALIDRKKVVVTEDIIRQDLRLDNADGVDSLPTEEIFRELARIVYEKPPP
nr:putative ribonuclease H-like domain-containing protein [Tanacetum cinerariifolium]